MAQIPPFCPNKECPSHHPLTPKWYRPFGSYLTKAHGMVARYICRRCRKSFSEQTFRLSYYLHLTISFKDLLSRICSCSGIRAIARSYGVSDKVISNRIGRLARQSIGLMARVRGLQRLGEALVADGFESFIHSQYSPNNIHLLIGKDSQYVYACDLAHLRRKGRMSERQKRRRERLERHDIGMSGELTTSFGRVCSLIHELAQTNATVELHTDEKREYQTVIASSGLPECGLVHHTTSSRRARTYENPLWAVNYYDRELRKGLANHVRQTTRWAQEANNCMERIYVYAGYHNFFKPFRIKERDTRTHAEVAGTPVAALRSLLKTFFTKRYFFSRISLSISEWLVWLRAYRTPFRTGFQVLPAYVTGQQRLWAMSQAA